MTLKISTCGRCQAPRILENPNYVSNIKWVSNLAASPQHIQFTENSVNLRRNLASETTKKVETEINKNPVLDDGQSVADDAIEARTRFNFVRYANCWEDADILVDALQAGPGKRILSIASAGDNSLALLATGAEVVAADLNPSQLACVEIRCAAFRRLEHHTMLEFLGIKDSNERLRIYVHLRNELTEPAKHFWDAREREISAGVIHHGKFEKYFQTFRRCVLPLTQSQTNLRRLIEPKSTADRITFWNQSWNNWRWRTLLRVFFSRFVMGRLGRDPEFFRYVDGSIADQIQRRAKYALTVLPTDSNPYLRYIATGNYSAPVALPRYLRRENFEPIRNGLDRLTLFQGPIQEAAKVHAGNGWDGFNLSDIFEYVSDTSAAKLYGSLLRHANPNARLAYWNTFVPRRCPNEFRNNVRQLDDLSQACFERDQAFFYNHFQIDEVISMIPV
jgi:S-adenosylmethionine-diacylglycerol 3-amino-3-carboxypropyl transferase